MRLALVYREHSEHARWVETFVNDYQKRTGNEIELIDPDSIRGEGFCRAYDVMSYPTLLAIQPDGSCYQRWQEHNWPLLEAIATIASI